MHVGIKHILFIAIAILAVGISADTVDSGDTAWILTSTGLVLLMTIPGLSLFYGGMVRQSNVLSVLMQCFAITCLITIFWVIVGFSLAFGKGDSAGWFLYGGLGHALFAGIVEDSVAGSIPLSVFAMFQLTFAIITPALIVGGFAERMRFSSLLVFSLLWSLLVYVPVTYWVWGGGWLGENGFMDFAGGAVVHLTAGVAAITAALYMGNRRGWPDTPLLPHNVPLCVIGGALLWVGWFGFNGGSALAANGDAAMALTATHISAATAAFTWMIIEWIRFGKPTVLGTLTGMVAGLGTITPASGFVGPAGALVIGIAAGVICFFATALIKRKLKIDDSLDVFSVHGVGGALGLILTAVFAATSLGVFGGQGYLVAENSMLDQLIWQLIGLFAVFAWTAIVTLVILWVVDKMIGLRVSEEEEDEGLDLIEHNERGYSL